MEIGEATLGDKMLSRAFSMVEVTRDWWKRTVFTLCALLTDSCHIKYDMNVTVKSAHSVISRRKEWRNECEESSQRFCQSRSSKEKNTFSDEIKKSVSTN